MKTLLIDNYDSYTWNLFQLLAEVNGSDGALRVAEKVLAALRRPVEVRGRELVVTTSGPASGAAKSPMQ